MHHLIYRASHKPSIVQPSGSSEGLKSAVFTKNNYFYKFLKLVFYIFEQCYAPATDNAAHADCWATILELLPHLEVVAFSLGQPDAEDCYFAPILLALRLAKRNKPLCSLYKTIEAYSERHSAACAVFRARLDE